MIPGSELTNRLTSPLNTATIAATGPTIAPMPLLRTESRRGQFARWSRALRARIAGGLVGQRAVGYLKLNELVQGDELVLEGVEASAVEALASTIGLPSRS